MPSVKLAPLGERAPAIVFRPSGPSGALIRLHITRVSELSSMRRDAPKRMKIHF